MADWRDRGYVPDSDEEEDDSLGPPAKVRVDDINFFQQSQIKQKEDEQGQTHGNDKWAQKRTELLETPLRSSPSQQSKPVDVDVPAEAEAFTSSTAEKLQAEIQRGLQTCKDVLEEPSNISSLDREDSPLSSLTSSPISSLPSLSQLFPARGISAYEQPLPKTNVSRLEAAPTSERDDGLDGIPIDQETTPLPIASRSLRPRTLLQINPYSLEYAKYQQDCKRRGLAPVRLANVPAERPQPDSGDTQGSGIFQSSERATSPERDLSSVSHSRSNSASQSPVRGSRIRTPSLGSDDELPDVADLLIGRVRISSLQRRKANRNKDAYKRASPKGNIPVFKRYDLPREKNTIQEDGSQQSSLFDLPPSPPRSGSLSSDQPIMYQEDDVLANHTTPRPLPTPVLSSDRLSLKRKVVEISSSSQEPSDQETHKEVSSADSDTDQDDSQGLMQIRRKIKGVLPASWLKFDAHQQKQKSTGQMKLVSPGKTATSRGVAKHLTSAHREGVPGGTAPRPLIFSSDLDDSDSSEAESRTQPTRHSLDLGFHDSDVDMDDVIVEEEIDRMEPPITRPFRSRTPGKKQQQRIDDSWRVAHLPKPRRNQNIQNQTFARAQRRDKKPRSKKIKRKHRGPQLSILDAPGFKSPNIRTQPSYLRVAARRHVSARRPVPQDPLRKFFKLATREDTLDINETLTRWRSGKHTNPRQENVSAGESSVHIARPNERSTVHEESADVAYVDALDQLKLSTTATVSKLRAHEIKHRVPYTGASASHAGGQRLAQILFEDAGRRRKTYSNVPSWLGQMDPVSRALPQFNRNHITPIQAHSSSSTLDQVLEQPSPITTTHEYKSRRPRKQKAPRRSVVSQLRLLDTDTATSILAPRTVEERYTADTDTNQDKALAIWTIDHLALVENYRSPEVSDMRSYRHDDDPAEEAMEVTFSKCFSWQMLLKTYVDVKLLGHGGGETSIIESRETTRLLQQLLVRYATEGRKAMFDNALLIYTKSTYPNPTARLAATLLIVHILCPIAAHSVLGGHQAVFSTTQMYDGWPVLHGAINDFLTHQSYLRGRGAVVAQELGLTAVRTCHLAVRGWHWQSADSIAKFWFKQYAENRMTELFVDPKLENLELRSLQTILSPDLQPSDTDFDIFLKIVATLLEERAASIGLSGNIGRASSRIQSLVFSLSPNNSRELSEDRNLKLEDLVSMANIYALYEYLNDFASSGSQPRFSLIEKLIDFPRCHWSVCQFALRTWSRFAQNAVKYDDQNRLLSLGSWMKHIVTQMVAKVAAARLDDAELRLSGLQFTVRENASRTWQRIHELLQAWKAAVIHCSNVVECRALLGDGDMENIIMICKDYTPDNFIAVLAICDIVQKYLDKSSLDTHNEFCQSLHRQFRDVMGSLLSSDQSLPSERLRALASLWFSLASAAVSRKEKYWDDFLSLPSPWSFGMLADTEVSRQCKVLFMSEIIGHDTLHFEMDREAFYTTWIEGLVQPEQNLRFENELTKAFMLHESEDLSLDHLRTIFVDANGHAQLSLSDLKLHRFDVVQQVIQNLFSLQFNDEDSQDFLEKPLDIHQGRNLLKLMTDTIKIKWRGLHVDQRQPYTDFAKDVITQLRIYKYKGFDIDPWFIDPAQPEFPKEVPFAKQFLLPINAPCLLVDEQLVRIFTSAGLQAAGTQNEEVFVDDMVRAFSANSTSMLDAEGKLAINNSLQFNFIRQIFTVLIDSVFKSPKYALFGRPVIAALVQLVHDWHFRLDITVDEVLQQMLSTSVDLLLAIRTALRSQEVLHFVAQGAAGELVSDLLELAIACTRRVEMLETQIDDTEENAGLVEQGFAHSVALYEHISGQNMDPGYLINADRQEDASLRGKVLEVLDEGLHGNHSGRNFVPAWRAGEPLAESWQAWLGGEDEMANAVEKHQDMLRKYEKVLIDADLLEGGAF